MRRTSTLRLLLVTLALTPVVAGAQSRAVVNANAGGNRALDVGRYEVAIEKYEKARKLAEDAGDSQYRAMAMYGLARANARLCRVTLAEQWFRDSISLRETIADDPHAFLTQNWIEFARFLLSIGRTEEGSEYFERAVPKLESMDIEKIDPIGYAELLDDLVAALVKTGKVEESKALVQRAAELRRRNPNRAAGFKPVPYPSSCATQ
jgi:tetratricopeptide (TPR) repeat protein